DSGYKVVILLSGITENLRRQTQERLDEGFIGRSSKAALQKNQETIRKGVGKIDPKKFAMAFTTEANDFKVNTLKSINMSLNNTTQPVLFVCKKNYKTLDNLISWLNTYNVSDANDTIDLSLLLIDDEADNASVNTRNQSDPTRINRLIRSLLCLFKRASYVGVTATPFANIFIEPDTKEDMLGDDLFPRDFIYAISPPSNYIGSDAIFGDNPKYNSSLELNDDAGTYFPFKHKSDLFVASLPQSLKKALNYFILVNAIRDRKGDQTTHRTMLINVSRFTAVQDKVTEFVIEWFHEIKRDIQNYYKLDEGDACRNTSMKNLKNVWDEFNLGRTGFTWSKIQKSLHIATAAIEVCAVNQRSSSSNLDYEAHKESDWRIVTVGGNSLSRGLTLEGLCVSYFYRNTQMYDTLMQMGRWFGYRLGYEDLFKIWMPQNAVDWYEHITEASSELRTEIRKMNQLNMTPSEFGLRVRAHPNSLIVTARNKMKSAKTIERWIRLDGEFFETPRLESSMSVIRANQTVAQRLLNNLVEVKLPEVLEERKKLWYSIPREIIIEFLKEYTNHPQNMESNVAALTDYIMRCDNLMKWDVVIPGGSGNKVQRITVFDQYMIERKMDKSVEGMLRISGTKLRVGAGGMTKNGLKQEEIKSIEEKFRQENRDRKNVPDKAYLIEDRRPILIIYYVQPKFSNDEQPLTDFHDDEPLIAYGIGFPRTGDYIQSRYVKYVINAVEQKNNFDIDEEDDDIDIDV
ncbi:Z1 domain-containing protein, partial [Peptococcaceae bacterium]|nr:Z1 domain-containing protein [Peptococcaceae bacterium]